MTEPTNAQSLENIIGDPIFKQNIGYAYDGNKNIFTFFTPCCLESLLSQLSLISLEPSNQ
jgi:hypothetical protein